MANALTIGAVVREMMEQRNRQPISAGDFLAQLSGVSYQIS